MAYLVGIEFMEAVEKLIDSNPSLADTLALRLNKEAPKAIEQGRKEYQEGEGIPVEDVLNENR